MDEKKNAYTILELQPGPELDEAAIKKAYRKLAIQKHPDKNRDNPNAAEEFAEVEQAYRLLLDKQARGALDDLLRAQAHRAERESKVSDKRRKMKEALERRERAAVSERSEEDVARSRLKVELERLRRKAEEEALKQRQHAAELSAAIAAQRSAAAAAAAGGAAPGAPSTSYGADGHGAGANGAPSEAVQAQLRRTLKVTWDPTLREYSGEELRAIFGGFGGPVQDVVLRDRRKKRKATALVVLGSEAAAARAAGSVCGDPADPLLVVPLVGDVLVDIEGGDAAAAAADAGKPGAADGGAGRAHADGGAGAGPGPQSVAAAGAGHPGGAGAPSLLQRPARLPDLPAGRPLFPGAGGAAKPAFPIFGGAAAGGGLFPSAAGAQAARPAFPAAAAMGGASTFRAWRNVEPVSSEAGDVGAADGVGGRMSFEDRVLERLRVAAAAKQEAAAARAAALAAAQAEGVGESSDVTDKGSG
ncbi:hypothetical protein HXX76_010676 [Chlamydomonas incerta]|uniref:J domain-containing protein n=1 Tax=Chlamydomonas incerta TaxID=51695 RepID=A0A835VYP1_CHLIN|nr:hypothetical protein HXX76_010676 [Chlamydomonas incerta]|eukprot:KAG2429896.1 hypothetical protein HXX76_010676 [Chlamydomonas incerta]